MVSYKYKIIIIIQWDAESMHFARKQPSEEACSHHLLNLWDIWALLIIIVLFYLAPPLPWIPSF